MNVCYHCGKPIDLQRKPGRTEPCPHCDADLHCCLNCRFYDPRASKQCREPQAEKVTDKEKGNFCEYFVFRDSKGSPSKQSKSGDARAQLDQLFKK